MQQYKDTYIRNDPRKTNEDCSILWSDNYQNLYNSKKYTNKASEHGSLGLMEGFTNPPNSSQNTKNQILSHYDVNGVKCRNLANNGLQMVNNNIIGNRIKLKNKERININGDVGVNRYDYNKDNYSYLNNNSKTNMKCHYGGKFEITKPNMEKKMYDINLPTLMKKEILGDVKEIDNIYNNKVLTEMSHDQMKVQNMKNIMKRLSYNLEETIIRANDANSLNDPFFQNMFL